MANRIGVNFMKKKTDIQNEFQFQSIKFLHIDNISPRVDSADVISLGFVPPISIS